MTKQTMDDVCNEIVVWQSEHKGAKGKCLGCTRWGLQQCGYELPVAPTRPGHTCDFAIDVGRMLAAEPARWGWQVADKDNLPDFALVFFDTDEPYGHVGIYKKETNHIISDITYTWNENWQAHLVYIFVPA